MAGVSTGQGAGKLDVELNLVPFIDLLSTLVLFLLVTAVWLQVSVIPAAVDSQGKSTASAPDQRKLVVRVTQAGYVLSWPPGYSGPGSIARGKGGYDSGGLVRAIRKAAGQAKLPMVAVSADDGVTYGAVVEAVDVIKSEANQPVALSTE